MAFLLGELDQEATEQTRLDCMGGIVVTILYGLARATSDLDVLPIAPPNNAHRCWNLAPRQ